MRWHFCEENFLQMSLPRCNDRLLAVRYPEGLLEAKPPAT
jgi:hypothetical protein